MPTRVEQKCCQNEPLNRTHIPEYEKGKCLLEYPCIQYAISDVSAQLSWMSQQRLFGLEGNALAFSNMTNRNYRHHAYRRYVDYIYGLLGRHIRKIVPACVVTQIRNTWPENSGLYVGFQAVDEDGHPINMDELEDELLAL